MFFLAELMRSVVRCYPQTLALIRVIFDLPLKNFYLFPVQALKFWSDRTQYFPFCMKETFCWLKIAAWGKRPPFVILYLCKSQRVGALELCPCITEYF